MSDATVKEPVSTVEAEPVASVEPETPAKGKGKGKGKGTSKKTDEIAETTTTKPRITVTHKTKTIYDEFLKEEDYQGDKTEYVAFMVSELKRLRKFESEVLAASENTAETDEEYENKGQYWFTSQSSKSKIEFEEHQSELKLVLEIEDSKPIFLTPKELIAHASRLSGMSAEKIKQKGAEIYAQSLISSFRKPNTGAGKGQLGSKDKDLNEAFIEVVKWVDEGSYTPTAGKIPITKIASRASANYNSAKGWAERNGFDFTFMDIDTARKITEKLKVEGF